MYNVIEFITTNWKTILMMYFSIGFVYVVINGFVRKLDSDGDWTIPLSMWFLWPAHMIPLIYTKIKAKKV